VVFADQEGGRQETSNGKKDAGRFNDCVSQPSFSMTYCVDKDNLVELVAEFRIMSIGKNDSSI